jgi:hypothetical protein
MVICLSGQMGLRGRPLANAGDGRNDRRTREGGLPMNDNGSLQHRASEAVRHATALSNRQVQDHRSAAPGSSHCTIVHPTSARRQGSYASSILKRDCLSFQFFCVFLNFGGDFVIDG